MSKKKKKNFINRSFSEVSARKKGTVSEYIFYGKPAEDCPGYKTLHEVEECTCCLLTIPVESNLFEKSTGCVTSGREPFTEVRVKKREEKKEMSAFTRHNEHLLQPRKGKEW